MKLTPDQPTFVPLTTERLACIALDHAQCDADHAGERFVECEAGTLAHRQRAELLAEIERLRATLAAATWALDVEKSKTALLWAVATVQ